MSTHIVYFDETGDDGITTASSDVFVLTALYMDTDDWKENFEIIKQSRHCLKDRFGFHVKEELHTKHLVRDKGMYRSYGWSQEDRKEILQEVVKCIGLLKVKFFSVIIDKNNIRSSSYKILENALKYSIQRIENDSDGKWNYLIVTDKGRVAPMRRTARSIRVYNPVSSHYGGIINMPIGGLIEDIFEKDSKESYFIQVCDFISFFTFLYYKVVDKKEELPKRVGSLIEKDDLVKLFEYLENCGVINTKASNTHKFGFVVYPK